MTVATQVISGVHVASDGGFVAGRVARATPVAGQHIDSSTVDATVLSSPISPIDGTWSLTLIRGVVYDVKIDRWAVRTIRVTDDPTQDFSYYLETSLEIADSEGRTIPPGSITQYLRGDRTWQTLDLSAVGLSGADPEVLTDLSDAAGVLNYKGQPIQGGTALPAPPDQTGNWAYVSLGGVQQWLELVEVTGGSVPVTVDGTAGTLGAEATAQAGTATPVGGGTSATTGAESATQAGIATAAGTGIVSATGTEATGEVGTGVAYVLNPGTALAVGAESPAETGVAAATGAGIVNAVGSESASETGIATASVTSGGTAAAAGAEGTAETGSGTATGNGVTAAAGAQGTSEVGTATASGGAPAIPATPTQSALTVGDAQLTASWSNVTGEDGYIVYYSLFADLDATNYTYEDDGAGGFTPMAYPGTPSSTAGKITGIAANSVSQVITGLTNDATYYVKVSAANAAGTSALSAAQSAAPHAPVSVAESFPTDGATLGAKWTKASWSTYSPKVASGQALGSSGLPSQNVAYWNPSVNAFAANQYAEVQFVKGAASSDSSLLLRVSPTAITYYACRLYGPSAQAWIIKAYNGSGAATSLSNIALGAITGTDVIRFSVSGVAPAAVVLSVYKNGVLMGTYTDSTGTSNPISSGQPGLLVGPTASTDPVDNFAAGDL